MNKYSKLIFWILFAGLILFIVAFGMPFVARINSSKVLTLAGCKLASFDLKASCPEGVNFAARFIPLNHWMSVFLAPIILIKQFWDILLVWTGLIAYFGNATKRRKSIMHDD
jgi:hypothetical protein